MKVLKAYYKSADYDGTPIVKPVIMCPDRIGKGEYHNITILTIDSDENRATIDDFLLEDVDDWGDDVDSRTREKLEKLIERYSYTIDWEQRRYELARELTSSCVDWWNYGFKNMTDFVESQLLLADEIIKQLKQKK